MQKSADSWRDWVCLFSVLPSRCPVSPTVSLCLFTDTNAYSTCLPCLSSGCPISLSALLSLQLGTCTIILTSRGLLPAPNTLLPSVSLVVSSPVSRTRGLTPTTVCLSRCQYDGLLCCALKNSCAIVNPTLWLRADLRSKSQRAARLQWFPPSHGCVESDRSFIRVWA